MKYFPIFLDLQGKLCVVIGGGRVAERKARSLLQAGAEVRVVSPQMTGTLRQWKEQGKILHRSRPFQGRDLDGAHLAIAATNDREANERIFRLCAERRIWVNGVDDPARSSFIVPSVVQRGDLVLAISTSGKSPAMARILRRKLEKEIGPEYSLWLKLLGAARKKILDLGFPPGKNRKIFHRLVQDDLGRLIRRGNRRGLEARLKTILGAGFRCSDLGIRL